MRGYSVAPVRPRGVRTIADIARFPAGSERAWMRPRPSIFRLLLHQFGVRSGKTPNEIPRPPVTSWRVTVEAWLRCPGLIVVRQNQKPNVTTTFSQMLVSQLSWTHMYADGAWARTNATLADGRPITPDLYRQFLPEELEKIKAQVGAQNFAAGKYEAARELFDALVTAPQFTEFLTLGAYGYLE